MYTELHENPDPEKIESLLMLLHNEGVNITGNPGRRSHPGEIQEILESIEGMPNEAQISRLTLRTMKQAKYTTGMQRTFRSCSEVLLSLYLSDPKISGSSDPQDHP